MGSGRYHEYFVQWGWPWRGAPSLHLGNPVTFTGSVDYAPEKSSAYHPSQYLMSAGQLERCRIAFYSGILPQGRKTSWGQTKEQCKILALALRKWATLRGEVHRTSLINACRSISQAFAFPNDKRTYWVFNRQEVKSYFLKMLLESQPTSSQAGSVTPSSMSKLKEQNRWWKQKTVVFQCGHMERQRDLVNVTSPSSPSSGS